MIKTISIDINSVVEFKLTHELIADFLDETTIHDSKYILKCIRDVENDVKFINTKLVTNIIPFDVYMLLFKRLGIQNDFESYFKTIQKILLKKLPQLNSDFLNFIKKLKEESKTIIVSGNNIWYTTETIMPLFYNCSENINSFIFSDLIGFSKPSGDFFYEIYKSSYCNTTEILHIGRDIINDMNGAENFGFKFYNPNDGLHIQNFVEIYNTISTFLK